MKNQYFADVNDYLKYGLLRTLVGNGEMKPVIHWMLTPDDGRNDGKFVNYLNDPTKWRKYDPHLFDSLALSMAAQANRSVQWLEDNNMIPAAKYFSEFLPNSYGERQVHFSRFREIAASGDLAFFDPDNGIEVKSVPYGRKDSTKYVYWHELTEIFVAGLSILIYQHFIHKKREIFIQEQAQALCEQLQISELFCLSTARVLFLLAPQLEHREYLAGKCEQIDSEWNSQIRVSKYRSA